MIPSNTDILRSPSRGSHHHFDPLDQHKEDVYKEHLKHRHIIINRQIDKSIIEVAVMQIERFNFEDDEKEDEIVGYDRMANPITIFINSYGGYCCHGLAMVSAMEQSRTPIITVAQGIACSMAFLILACGHRRYAYRHAELMYHQSSGGEEGMVQDRVEALATALSTQERLDSILLEHSKITVKKLKEVNERKINWYMWADEALKYGFIDEIIQVGLLKTPKKAKEVKVEGPVEEPAVPKKVAKKSKSSAKPRDTDAKAE